MNDCTIFWGTGEVGHNALKLWKRYGLCPDYYCDNNKENQGRYLDGVEIISPQKLYQFPSLTIFITCDAYGAVKAQLDSMKLENVRVLDGAVYSVDVMMFIRQHKGNELKLNWKYTDKNKCLFDFYFGTTLGGVQTWSYMSAAILRNLGVQSEYLMPDNVPHECGNKLDCIRIANANDSAEYDDYFWSYVQSIVESGTSLIICNFPRAVFNAAVFVKRLYHPQLHVIAVVHSDDDIYYDIYSRQYLWVDVFLVNNNVMKEKLIRRGVPESKIVLMKWKMSPVSVGNRRYSKGKELLRIGYAGRIELIAKRIDLILTVAELLKERGVFYRLEIAGEGSYVEYLLEEIEKKGLNDTVFYLGLVSHEDIYRFWQRQDIFLSCSDYEGRCISQYEAMLNGAVPVVTNTSGTNDDIEDGINGFIVPIGDVEKIVEKIEYLSENRERLEKMGRMCADAIKNKNNQVDETAFWREVLREII